MSNWKTDHSEKIIRFCYEEMTQLDYEDYHLPHYSLLYKEELRKKGKAVVIYKLLTIFFYVKEKRPFYQSSRKVSNFKVLGNIMTNDLW